MERQFENFVTVICGLHFDRTLKTSCGKYDQKCYHQWHLSILLNVYNY